MKNRRLILIMCVCITVLMNLCMGVIYAVTPYAENEIASAVYGTPEKIDGILDSGWDNANTYSNAKFVGVEENETEIAADWKVMYDDSYLYFYVDITDSTIGDAEYEFDESGAYYAKNSIHLMFDLGYERSTVYDANDFYIDISSYGYYNNHTPQAYDYVESAVVLTDTGYTVEVRVDFSFYPDFSPSEGTCFGFDLWANDNLYPVPGRIFARTWADNTDSAWNNPSSMGTVQLSAKPAQAAVTPEAIPEPETVPTAPAAEVQSEPANIPTTTAPATGDTFVLVPLLIAALAFLSIKYKKLYIK